MIRQIDGVAHAGGFSSPVDEKKGAAISLEQFLIPHPQRTFMIRIKGDSLEGVGIVSGDYVLVERGTVPKNGQYVLVKQHHRMVVKQWIHHDRGTFLRSAHEDFEDIPYENDMECVGVVVAVVRKYG